MSRRTVAVLVAAAFLVAGLVAGWTVSTLAILLA